MKKTKEAILASLSKYKYQARQIHPNTIVVPYERAMKAVNQSFESAIGANLHEAFEKVCDSYRRAFARKHGYSEEHSHWIDEVGGVCDYGFAVANFDGMRFDIDNDIPAEKYDEFIEYICEAEDEEISYKMWILTGSK